mgnify:CR=1 FL=1
MLVAGSFIAVYAVILISARETGLYTRLRVFGRVFTTFEHPRWGSVGDGSALRTKFAQYATLMLGLFLSLCLASCSKPPPDRPGVQQDQFKPAYWPVSLLKGVYLGGVRCSSATCRAGDASRAFLRTAVGSSSPNALLIR